jgi:hypothetical protein
VVDLGVDKREESVRLGLDSVGSGWDVSPR